MLATAAAALLALAWLATFAAGGSRTPYPHLFYLPIISVALAFRARMMVATAVAATILAGPLMPLNTHLPQAQPAGAWLMRGAFFLLVGGVVSVGRRELLNAVTARQSFLSSVSHELRTPLASIVGFSALLRDRSGYVSHDEFRELATIIHKEATSLADVVDHFVLAGRLTDDALVVETRTMNLTRTVKMVLETLPDEVKEARVRVSLPTDLSCVADAIRVRQIVRCMLVTALGLGGDRVTLRASRVDRVHLSVTTTFDGIVEPSRQKLVQRIDPRPVTDDEHPLGLGIAVSRRLARLMGGDLVYEVDGSLGISLLLPGAQEPVPADRPRATRA